MCWREGRGSRAVGCCCYIWMCAREIPPQCPSLPHFTCVQNSITSLLPLSLPLTSPSEIHLIRLIWGFPFTRHPWICISKCAHMQACMFDTSRIGPFVHPNDLNFSVPPGFASLCIDQKFQTKKKSQGKMNYSWDDLLSVSAEFKDAQPQWDGEFLTGDGDGFVGSGWNGFSKHQTVQKVQENGVPLDYRQTTVI